MTNRQIKILELELTLKELAVEKKGLIKKGFFHKAATVRDKEALVKEQLKQLI